MDIQVVHKEKFGIGTGFDYRTIGTKPKTLLIHTTNGNLGTTYTAEVNYLYTSRKVSAGYIVGKKYNQITQLLPDNARAWHAGAVNNSLFNNNNSIGIECHYTPGEGLWTSAMFDNLTYICRVLISRHGITSPGLIERHRTVAIPKGRKIDPSGFFDYEFLLWRKTLFEETKPVMIKYKVIQPAVNIRTAPRIDPTNIVGKLYKDDIFESIVVKTDEKGQYIDGINTYAHLTIGTSRGKKVDGLGFVHVSNLRVL